MTVTASAPATCLPMDAQTRAMFDDTLDRFVDEHYTPAARLARLKKRPTDYRTHWAALAELGILGAGLPEALGGVEGEPARLGARQEAELPRAACAGKAPRSDGRAARH